MSIFQNPIDFLENCCKQYIIFYNLLKEKLVANIILFFITCKNLLKEKLAANIILFKNLLKENLAANIILFLK